MKAELKYLLNFHLKRYFLELKVKLFDCNNWLAVAIRLSTCTKCRKKVTIKYKN